LSRVRIVNNTLTGAASAFGPVFVTAGEVAIRDSEIVNNSASSTLSNAFGGAVYAAGAGVRVAIENSTISGNSVNVAASNSAFGGGIYVNNGAQLVMKSTTLANNTAASSGSISTSGGNLWSSGATPVTIQNSIIANGSARFPGTNNCAATTPTFVERNIISDASCGAAAANRTIADPLLLPVANNGGPTNSRALGTGSPAIDAAGSCLTATDQRGQARPLGLACDLGAIEAGADLDVSQAFSNTGPAPGSDVILTTTVANRSLNDAPQSSLSLTVPGAAQVLSVSTAQGSCGSPAPVMTCQLGTVRSTGPVTVLVSVRMPQSGTVTATAAVSTDGLDQNQGNDFASASATIPAGVDNAPPPASACALVRKGTQRADRLTGTTAGDRMLGLAGNDVLKGLAGDDCLTGGAGRDRLIGGAGKDQLVGGAGPDTVRARDRVADRVTCGAGRDVAVVDKVDRVGKDCEVIRRR